MMNTNLKKMMNTKVSSNQILSSQKKKGLSYIGLWLPKIVILGFLLNSTSLFADNTLYVCVQNLSSTTWKVISAHPEDSQLTITTGIHQGATIPPSLGKTNWATYCYGARRSKPWSSVSEHFVLQNKKNPNDPGIEVYWDNPPFGSPVANTVVATINGSYITNYTVKTYRYHNITMIYIANLSS